VTAQKSLGSTDVVRVSDDRERRRAERDARRQETRQRKADERSRKQADAEARAEKELRLYGRQVASGTFGGKSIRIYDNGFVSVGPRFGSNVTPQRLRSIDASADVGKKTAVGRTVGWVMTGGLNVPLSSNKRGDVYLTVVTDTSTFALHETPPTKGNMKNTKLLEAAGHSVLARVENTEPADGTSNVQPPRARDRLVELQSLVDDGLITDEEFDQKRRSLLAEL
jgi:hypothetical protein